MGTDLFMMDLKDGVVSDQAIPFEAEGEGDVFTSMTPSNILFGEQVGDQFHPMFRVAVTDNDTGLPAPIVMGEKLQKQVTELLALFEKSLSEQPAE